MKVQSGSGGTQEKDKPAVVPSHHSMTCSGDAQILWEALRRASVEKARRALDQKEVDPMIGIAIAEIEAGAIAFGGQSYHLYAARVFPRRADGGQPYVTPHFHKIGCEPYYFLDGQGEMHMGDLDPDGRTCAWRPPIKTEIRGRLLIRENEVHSFRNTGDRPVDFLFACPKSHLIDHSAGHPEGDRHLVRESPEGGEYGRHF